MINIEHGAARRLLSGNQYPVNRISRNYNELAPVTVERCPAVTLQADQSHKHTNVTGHITLGQLGTKLTGFHSVPQPGFMSAGPVWRAGLCG